MLEVVGNLRAALATVSQEEREAVIDALDEILGALAHPLIDGNVPLWTLVLMVVAALPPDTEKASDVLRLVAGLPFVEPAPAVNPTRKVDR